MSYIILNPIQKQVFNIIKKEKRFGIFLDMGIGKTATILSLIDELMFNRLEDTNVLILAPAGLINKFETWQNEIMKWANFRFINFVTIKGTPDKRKDLFDVKKTNQVVLMSNALLNWWNKTYEDLSMFNLVIIDESSDYKDHKTLRFKLLSKMINRNQRMYLLSGTPIPNGMINIWSQMYLLDFGDRLGTNYYRFEGKYFYKGKYKTYITKKNKEIITESIKDICLFVENKKANDNIEYIDEYVDWDNDENFKTYKNFQDSYILELKSKNIIAFDIRTMINKCLQLSNGCVYDKNGNTHNFDNSKIEWVRKYSEEHPNENILVAYSYKFDKERLLKLPDAVEITSEKLWNSEKVKIGVISPYSLQRGGNLQDGGHTLIHFGLNWNLENYLQINRRLRPDKQEKKVKIIHLMHKDTYDVEVLKALNGKDLNEKKFLQSLTSN